MFETYPERMVAVLRSRQDFDALGRILARSNWRPLWASSIGEAERLLLSSPSGVVVCEAELPDGRWQDLAARTARQGLHPLIVVASRLADEELWTAVLTFGGFDLVAMPFHERELLGSVAQAWRQCRANARREELQVA
ncbi:MAG: hypothetical protein U0Q16_23505 [Bryobacteraceae bacterium]